jgi:hypothetical protein
LGIITFGSESKKYHREAGEAKSNAEVTMMTDPGAERRKTTYEQIKAGVTTTLNALIPGMIKGGHDMMNEGKAAIGPAAKAFMDVFSKEYLSEVVKMFGNQKWLSVFGIGSETGLFQSFFDRFLKPVDTKGPEYPSAHGGIPTPTDLEDLGEEVFKPVGDSLTEIGGGGGLYAGSMDVATSMLGVQREMASYLNEINVALAKSKLVVTN